MTDKPTAPPVPLPTRPDLRPLTWNLVHAIALDAWPSTATCMDFGLATQKHYEAVYYPYRNGEITVQQLEAALGSGPKLTELVNAAPSNPHKGIRFETPWDSLLEEPEAFGEVEGRTEPSRDDGLER